MESREESNVEKVGESLYVNSLVSRRFSLQGDELQLAAGDNDTALVFADRCTAGSTSHGVASVHDSTFCVVPTLFYLLFTVFVSYAERTFPVCCALMTRKTAALYEAVLQKVHELVPEFQPTKSLPTSRRPPLLPYVLCSGTLSQCQAVGFTLRKCLLNVYANRS